MKLVVGSVYGFTEGEACGIIVGERMEVDGKGVV